MIRRNQSILNQSNTNVTTKTGKLFYEELVRPMQRLAERNKKMGIEKLSKINKEMIEDMMIINNRK